MLDRNFNSAGIFLYTKSEIKVEIAGNMIFEILNSFLVLMQSVLHWRKPRKPVSHHSEISF